MSLAVGALILQIVTTTLSVFDHVVPIKRHLGYTFRYKTKLEKLKEEVRQLDAERESLQHSVNEELGQGNEIHDNDVVNWLSRVDTTIQVAGLLIQDEDEEAKKRCFSGVCPNLKRRYLLGKRADEEASRIAKFKEEKSRFGPISYRPSLQQTLTAPVLPLPQIVKAPVPGYKAESREELLKRVMEKLLDPNVDIIGLYGMGGIGKTTLAKEVYKQATLDKLFDVVVMVEVTAQPQCTKIQDGIAELSGLEMTEKNEDARAGRLYEGLKKRKFLIILDNLWGELDFEKIGIPTGTGSDGKGCKILLTSRSSEVLFNTGSKCNFKVEDLSKEEAMSLFQKKVDVVEYPEIAKAILSKCRGFPLLIVTMAALVRNKPQHTWEDSLTQLSRFNSQDLEAKVHSVLKLSYDHLVNDETKLIFLLYGICPQSETTILDLLKYCWGLGIFKDYTFKQARNRLNRLIDDLIASSLLLDVDEKGFMKMHDTVRGVAIRIACTDQRAFRVVDGKELKEWPKDDLKNCTKISMPLCRIQELPEDLECPSVEFFLLFLKGGSLNVPDSAFQHTKELKVLHFKGMKFSPVPNSLCSLTNLHTLCLDNCYCCDVSIIGQLKNLEILSFRGSHLQRLPHEIGQLTQLKLLDLSHCSRLKVIPANVLSKLSALEELLMRNSFDQWEAQNHHNRSNASLADLEYLSHLNTMEVKVHSAEAFTEFSFSEKLKRYRIEVGDQCYFHEEHESSKTIVVAVDTNTDILPAIQKLLKETETLMLRRLIAGSNIFNSLKNKGFPKLKNLFVDHVTDIQYITDNSKAVINRFPMLESLKLRNLASLVNICHGELASESFGKLRSLNVYNCNKLKYLFSISMVRGFSQLEEIDVQKCENMEGIIVKESDNSYNKNETVELPLLESFGKLRKLAVSNCNKLKYLFSISMVRGLSQLEEIYVQKCKNMEGIIVNESDNGHNGNEAVELPLLESFGKLRKVTVYNCNKLKYLFSISMVRGFSQLEKIEVRTCENMEGIIVNESDNGHNGNEAVELPLLESFGKLRKLAVSECNKLKYLFSISMVGDLSQLEEIDVQKCKNMEGIIVNESDNGHNGNEAVELPLLESFGKLWKLAVSECNKLKYLFSISMVGGLSQLEEIDVQECENMEGIIVNESDNGHNGNEAVELPLLQSFGKLKKVTVYNCNKLKYLFSISMVRGLSQLEKIEVRTCENMEGIIVNESDNGHNGNEAVELPLLESFGKLRKLVVSECNKLKYLFSISMVGGLSQLEEIDVQKCKNMEGIIVNESDNGHNGNEAVELPLLESFVKLRKLAVSECNKLKYFFSISMVKGLSQLEEIEVRTCENMEGIIVNESDNGHNGNEAVELPLLESFGKLRKVTVYNCNKLKYLFSISMVRGLSQLEKIEVRTCENMEGIIVNESDNGHNGNEAVELPLLESFGKLRKLVVSECNKLKYLFSISMVGGLSQLEEIDVQKCKNMEGIIVNESDNGHNGNEAVELPLLESFVKLRKLAVSECNKLKYLFSISMVRGLSQLEEIEVRTCENMKGIIVNESDNGHNGNEAVELPLLESFGKLRKVTVYNCNKLKYLFSISMVRGLSQLEEIEVRTCKNMEGIIVNENDNGHNRNEAVELPLLESFGKLRKVTVNNCNKLKYLFSISMVRGLSQLEEIEVLTCKNMEGIIVNESDNGHNGNEAVELPLLESFGKLRKVTVNNCNKLKYLFSISMVRNLSQLEEIEVRTCENMEGIIVNESDNSHNGNEAVELPLLESFGKLRKVTVYNCNKLKYLFSISMVRGLSQLEEIEVLTCKNMEGIIVNESDNGHNGNEAVELPLLESFGKLRKVTVNNCNKLKYLFSISMVRNLSQLEEIEVRTCENMEGIIVNESDNSHNGNEAVELPLSESFGKLRKVTVNNCNKLKYLFSISMVRGLSQLVEIEVRTCENMEGIIVNESDNGHKGNEAMELPLLESFGKLRKVTVYNCNKLKYLFSISMVRGLSQLEEIKLWTCKNIETIIVNESDNGHNGNEAVELPRLRDLNLASLPQLQGFTSKGLLSLFDETVVLPSLEKLAISDCDNFKMLWNNPLNTSSFGELKKLLIKNCHNLLTVFPSNILERFQKLEELHIEHCDSIEVIYHLQESSFNKTNDSIAGFQLRILRMISLTNLVHIWSVDLPGTICLKNLRCLVFPQLTELVIDNLPELISFCTDHMLSIEWPQLKFLQVTGCEKAFRCTLEQFNAQNSSREAQGFPNCEKMMLDGRSFIGMVMQPSKFQLPSLTSLELRSRIGWWARYPESSVWLHIQRLPNLRELTLQTLQLRELMLYPHEGQGGGGGCLKALATHPIPNITVTSYNGLIQIMNKTELEKFATNPYIERVEILSLEACLFLENVAPTLVSNFSSLTSLHLSNCHRLISLVTISVATSLVQLKHMNIRYCRMLREILTFDDAAATNNARQENIVFPKLETLDCFDLPSLRGFYMGSHTTLEFPSLVKVHSERCHNMNVFSCGTLKTPKLKGDLNSTIRDKCFKMDYFTYIRGLKLDPSFPWLVEQWHSEQLPFQVFRRLETLVVDNCSCFLFAVPWNLLSSSTTLKSLSIERCDSLENVFDPEKLKNEDLRHVGSVALLEHLHLVDLPKLRNVWNKDPHGILDIRNLQVLKVHNCGNLTELFTLSMALDLVHLRDLEVKQCTLLQVVIKKEEDEQVASNSTVFPSLESLYLEYLPSLTSLYSGSYVLNFKGLCKVTLVECPNMRICAFTPTTEEGDPRDIVEGNEEDSRNYLCFLGCKVEVSNIQELKVEWNNLLVMWTANNQAEFLKNLEVLELLYFPEEDLNSVPDLLQKFSKLERLVLNSSFFKKIVLSSFNIKDENQWSYEQVLISTSLPCLNHLMVEDSKPIRDFKYPDCLEVSNCNILRILVLPSVYFETLTTLDVSKCHGLINLIASSAARSMVHLKRMTVSECEMVTEIVASKEDGVTVSECEMVTEIVASEEDGAKAEICFRELEHLQLHCLPCLTSFCSGDLCFTFPSLKKVVVIKCPKMNTFAPNILRAPLVWGVQITEADDEEDDEARWLWEGSLNSTIEGLYMEMVSI